MPPAVCSTAGRSKSSKWPPARCGCCSTAVRAASRRSIRIVPASSSSAGRSPQPPDWSYSTTHREGVIVDLDRPGIATVLDARDLIPPFTPGALRGGSHVHIFSPDSKLVSFTYEDAVLEKLDGATPGSDRNARAVGVTVMDRAVEVPTGLHNERGVGFSVLVTALVDHPAEGSDQISRAREEAWVGTHGYLRPDGTRQRYALAFQGQIHSQIDEVFIVDLPDDLTIAGDGPLQGTESRRPFPPAGTQQRRLTYTTDQKHPGIQGPRHWLRSSPDGSAIGFLMRDDAGVVQFCTVSPNGGPIRQITRGSCGVDSAFSWHPDGRRVAAVMDGSVVTIDAATGRIDRLTRRSDGDDAPRPEACVFSPDGSAIAYVRRVTKRFPTVGGTGVSPVPCDPRHEQDARATKRRDDLMGAASSDGSVYNQIFVVDVREMLEPK